MSAKTYRRSVKREEEKTAAALGGRRTFNSGAGDEKGDGRVPFSYQMVDGEPVPVSGGYRLENKMTSKKSYRLSVKDWTKLSRAARREGEEPIFIIRVDRWDFTKRRLVILDHRFASSLFGVRGDYYQYETKTLLLKEPVWTAHAGPGDLEGPMHLRVLMLDTQAPVPGGIGARRYDLVAMLWDDFKHYMDQ